MDKRTEEKKGSSTNQKAAITAKLGEKWEVSKADNGRERKD